MRCWVVVSPGRERQDDAFYDLSLSDLRCSNRVVGRLGQFEFDMSLWCVVVVFVYLWMMLEVRVFTTWGSLFAPCWLYTGGNSRLFFSGYDAQSSWQWSSFWLGDQVPSLKREMNDQLNEFQWPSQISYRHILARLFSLSNNPSLIHQNPDSNSCRAIPSLNMGDIKLHHVGLE